MRVPASFFILVSCLSLLSPDSSFAQSGIHERVVPQPKISVERALKELQEATYGRLPALEGFVSAGSRPLERFQRPYYQLIIQVEEAASGGSVVRVSAKITAWYNDAAGARSGYKTIPSNGRLEADLLDQLSDALAGAASAETVPAPRSVVLPKHGLQATIEQIHGDVVSAGIANSQPKSRPLSDESVAAAHVRQLQEQVNALQQILQNQTHPSNLVAVKTSNTPVLATPRLDARVLFYASAQDEFEILDLNSDWVHVRISGLSRGWIRRSTLEMPGAPPEAEAVKSTAVHDSTEQFRVSTQETAPFPGKWEPLRGKTVQIISVQKVDGIISNPQTMLAYARLLFEKTYPELSQRTPTIAGVLLIFDSEDGGMIAVTLGSLQQWKMGTLSDDAFWRQCFFDPPESFGSPSALSVNE